LCDRRDSVYSSAAFVAVILFHNFEAAGGVSAAALRCLSEVCIKSLKQAGVAAGLNSKKPSKKVKKQKTNWSWIGV